MTRALFLGFDSMDIGLTRHWAAEGRLPNFAEVFATCSSRPTLNPEGLLVGALWPAFWSGGGPAHHGSYCWRQLVPGTYTTASMKPTDFDTVPFWVGLDEAGVRCAIFDVPLVRPIPLRNGVHIVDWGSHDSQLDTTVTDPSIAQRLETLGRYPQKRCDITVSEDGLEELVAALHTGVAMRSEALSLLFADDYDFVASVFSETHCAGHHLFHLHEATHPCYDPELVARFGGDPLLSVYRDVDAALGRILTAVHDDVALMLLFSHSVSFHYDGNQMLAEITRRISEAHRPVGALTRLRERFLVPLRGVRRRLLRTFAPRRLHPRKVRNLDGTAAWFEIPNNDVYGAIRLNLRGREPWGRVRPGADYEQVIQTITEELLSLRHEATGTPAVSRVLRTDDYHHGPRRNMLPDLLVEWNWTEPFVALTSPTIGVVRSTATPLRTGDHRPYGEVFVKNLVLPATGPLRVESLAQLLVDRLQHND